MGKKSLSHYIAFAMLYYILLTMVRMNWQWMYFIQCPTFISLCGLVGSFWFCNIIVINFTFIYVIIILLRVSLYHLSGDEYLRAYNYSLGVI